MYMKIGVERRLELDGQVSASGKIRMQKPDLSQQPQLFLL